MAEHKLQKMHPHHKGGGMPYFEKDHWQKDVKDVTVCNEKYGTEFGAPEEYKKSVDALSAYAKRHKEKH
jgi:hypothetical protein